MTERSACANPEAAGQMMRSRLQAIFQLSGIAGLSGQRLNTVFDRLREAGKGLQDVPDMNRQALVRTLGFSCIQAGQFAASATRAARGVERMDPEGLSIVTRADSMWPKNLRRDDDRAATPWLFVLGNPSLLTGGLIGIGGSRGATERSETITGDLVRCLVDRDVVIVSGGARGIDTAAHAAALGAGGRTIVVLAQGIGTFRVPSPWRDPIRQGRLAIVSEYLPQDDWEAFRALQRNATIVQMSDSFIVAQAGASGGTLSAGQAALKMRWPLHVVRQTGFDAEIFPGNELLIREGGRPVLVSPSQAITDDVIETVLASTPPSVQRQAQLELF
jgi:DNA processing protein